MSDDLLHSGRVEYRAKRSQRLGVLLGGVVILLIWLGMHVSFILILGPKGLEEMADFLGADLDRYGGIIGIADVLLFLVLGSSITYGARYWWTYRIVLDQDGVSREGLWHPLDRKLRIPYGNIERITRGTRYVLRVIPRQGKVLATNVKILEEVPEGLIANLRARVGSEIVDTDLEHAILSKQSRDKRELVFVVASIGFLAVIMAGFFIQDQILALFAWQDVVAGRRHVVAFDVGPDGTVWALTEGKLKRGELGLKLEVIGTPGRQSIELPLSGLAREVSHPYDPVYNNIEDIVADSRKRVWVLFEESGTLHYWEGTRWSRLRAADAEIQLTPTSIARVGEEVWVIRFASEGVLRIDSESLAVAPFSIHGVRYEGDPGVTLYPETMIRGNDGGVVMTGGLNLGYPGIAHFNSEGANVQFFGLDESIPLPDSSWNLIHGGTDRVGRLYAFYASKSGCSENTLSVIAGVQEQPGGEWKWGSLSRPLDCSKYWSLPSVAVDPHGRIWVEVNAFEGGGVMVYEEGTIDGEQSGNVEPIRQYTEKNSHFIGEDLQVASDGHIYAIEPYAGNAVWIDASGDELPNPAPRFLVELLDKPYLVYIPYLAVAMLLTSANVRRNWSREWRPDGERESGQ